ncbi:hypothetical protein ACP70R_041229 [Stipagrostis hirtigluma subsp. patula]
MGKKTSTVLGFLGLTTTETEKEDEGEGEWQRTGRHRAARRVRPSDDDGGGYDGRTWWYAERDIDRRASEFIDRVHRGIMLDGDAQRDGGRPASPH